MLIPWLFACNPDPPVLLQATGGAPPPVLVEVTARCAAGVVVLRARTEGWAKEAQFDLYDTTDPELPVVLAQGLPLPTVGFLPDQSCDIMEAIAHAPCEGLTIAVKVDYEDDCAGCAVFGHDPAAVYRFLDDPNERDDECHFNDDFCEDDVASMVSGPEGDAATCSAWAQGE